MAKRGPPPAYVPDSATDNVSVICEVGNCSREWAMAAMKRSASLEGQLHWVLSNPEDTAVLPPVTPPLPPPVVQWECSSCSLVNTASSIGCVACGTAPPDDWLPELLKDPRRVAALGDEEMRRIRKQAQAEAATRAMLETERRLDDERKEKQYRELAQASELKVAVNAAEFECPVCYDDVEEGEGILMRNCGHELCKECFTRHCEARISSNDTDIQCCVDECEGLATQLELSTILPAKLYKKWEEFMRRAQVNFTCVTVDCAGMCAFDEGVNTFQCYICGKTNCLNCKAIHEGKNCKQYQDDLKIAADNDVALKQSLDYLQEEVRAGRGMKCPGPQCGIVLVKNGGCNWMQCTSCKTEVCWATMKPRRPAPPVGCGGGHACH